MAEEFIWSWLRANRIGFHFRREATVANYRVDFYCAEAKLAIEMDGEQHDAAYDSRRDELLRQCGVEVYRIPNVSYFRLDGSEHLDFIRIIVQLCEARSGRRAGDKAPRRGGKPPPEST